MSEVKQARLFSALALCVAFLGWVRPTAALNPPVFSQIAQLRDVSQVSPVAGAMLSRNNSTPAKWQSVQGELNVQAFGAKGDGSTDDTAAFNAALTYIASLDTTTPTQAGLNNHNKGACLYVPRTTKFYRLTSQLRINRGLTLRGDGGSGWYGCSEMRWDDNTSAGLEVDNAALSSDGGSGDWSLIRDLILSTNTLTPVNSGHGVTILAHGVRIEHCYITDFHGDGVHIDSSVAGSNCNGWRVDHCRIDQCVGNGIYVHSGNSNAGGALDDDIGHITLDGIFDDAQFANTYEGCGVATCSGTNCIYLRDATALGIYTEGSQNPVFIGAAATWIGGTPGSGFDAASTGGVILAGSTNGSTFQTQIESKLAFTGQSGVQIDPPGGFSQYYLRCNQPNASTIIACINSSGKYGYNTGSPSFSVESDTAATGDGIGVNGTLTNTAGNSAGFFFNATAAQHSASLVRYTPASAGRLAGAVQLSGVDSGHIILTPATGKVLVDGGLGVAGSISAAVSGAQSTVLPIYDSSGNLLGYLPIYASHT